MKNLIKKSLAYLLTVIICISVIPASVFAAENKGAVIDSGSCGENVTYTLYESGLMEITGTGDMYNHNSGDRVPYFDNYNDIVEVVVDEGVTSIGESAFEYCSGLESIVIGNNVTSIGPKAFRGCDSLKSVTIGDSVTDIGSMAFYCCVSLTDITFPDSLTTIGFSAFDYCERLTSVIFGDGITSIDFMAFRNCSGITSVTIPGSVTSVGGSAFGSCNNLKEIIFEGDAPTFGDSVFLYTDVDLYFYCDRKGWADVFLDIDMHARHTGVDESGDMCTACGNKVEWGICMSEGKCGDDLRYAIYTEGVINITGTGEMYDYEYVEDAPYSDYRSKIKKVVIDDGVTSIGNYAFSECEKLTSVTIPDSVKHIGEWVFDHCTSLTSVELPDSIESIGGNIFAYCSSLSFEGNPFPEKAEIVGDIVLAETNITEIEIPYGVTRIADYAFTDCEKLTSIVIPDSVTIIGESAFQNCSNLSDVVLPEKVERIYDYAFANCKSITSITIPASVRYVYGYAFDSCENLNEIIFRGKKPVIYYRSFGGVNATVYYPCNITWNTNLFQDYEANFEFIMLHGEMEPCEVAVTCTEDGYTGEVCVDCGTVFKSNITKATGHNMVDGKCTVCGYSIDAPVIKASNVVSSGKNKLTWNKVDGAVKYQVYRSTSKNGKYSLMKTVTNGTSYTNTNAVPGKYYYYYVLAVDEGGVKSVKSNIVGRTCDYARPAVTATNDAATGKPKLTWTAVEGATSYKVYRSTKENGTYSLMKTVKDGATSYINANAVAGKKYYYKVKAYGPNSSATSAYSTVDARTCDLARPVVKITTSSGKPKLTWTAVEGATSYKVYRSTTKDGKYTLMKTVKNGATTYTNTNAVKGKTYYYKVIAVHSNTNANSAYSAVKSIKCTK